MSDLFENNSTLDRREDKQCKDANWGKAAWKFRLSG